MAMTIAILEDNHDRQTAMRDCLEDRFPQYPLRFFATAAEMLRYLQLNRDDILAVALDHDLEFIPGADERLFDPGTGRDVADYLASQPPMYPVVIHTTNCPAGAGMQQALQDAGWETICITPYGDLEWIPEVWFPAMRNAIVQTAVPKTHISATGEGAH